MRDIIKEQYFTEAQIEKEESQLERILKRGNKTPKDWYLAILQRMAELSLDAYYLHAEIGISIPTAFKFMKGMWDPYTNKHPKTQFIIKYRLSVLLARSQNEATNMLAMAGIVLNGMDNKRDLAACYIMNTLHYADDFNEDYDEVYPYNYKKFCRLISKAESTGMIEPGVLGKVEK